MGFRSKSFAKVWDVKPVSEYMTQLRISTSRKNKQTDQYEQDFSGFVAFVGADNAKAAAALNAGDRIQLGDVDVTTTYDKAKGKEYVNYKAFSFTKDGMSNSSAPKKEVDDGELEAPDEGDSDLPF